MNVASKVTEDNNRDAISVTYEHFFLQKQIKVVWKQQ